VNANEVQCRVDADLSLYRFWRTKMAAINTSISYQSQFATPNSSLNDMSTQSAAQEQMEKIKGSDLKPISSANSVQNTESLGEHGQHINLKA
jgi:hypothetical protein